MSPDVREELTPQSTYSNSECTSPCVSPAVTLTFGLSRIDEDIGQCPVHDINTAKQAVGGCPINEAIPTRTYKIALPLCSHSTGIIYVLVGSYLHRRPHFICGCRKTTHVHGAFNKGREHIAEVGIHLFYTRCWVAGPHDPNDSANFAAEIVQVHTNYYTCLTDVHLG